MDGCTGQLSVYVAGLGTLALGIGARFAFFVTKYLRRVRMSSDAVTTVAIWITTNRRAERTWGGNVSLVLFERCVFRICFVKIG